MTPMSLRRRLAQQEARALRLLHNAGGRTVAPLNWNVPVDETTPLHPGALEAERERARRYREAG